MKRPHLHFPKVDYRSLSFQTVLELMLGGLLIALLLRWVEM